MLSMNEHNCARYGAKFTPLESDANSKLEKTMTAKYPDIWNQMRSDNVSGAEMCDYLNWAWYSRVALKGDMDKYKEI